MSFISTRFCNIWLQVKETKVKFNNYGNKSTFKEYLEKYIPTPNTDPHGGLEDFIEAEKINQQCIPAPVSKISNVPNEDEML